MFERFTERARDVLVFAQEEARSFKHSYIGTEHILLGMIREEQGLAARVLDSFNITLEDVREQVVRIVGTGEEVAPGQIPFTPRAKRILELARRESVSLGHHHIGTEHILLGLVRENEGVGARILLDSDASAHRLHDAVIRMLKQPKRMPPGQNPLMLTKQHIHDSGLASVMVSCQALSLVVPGVTVAIEQALVVTIPADVSQEEIEALKAEIEMTGWTIDPDVVPSSPGSLRAV